MWNYCFKLYLYGKIPYQRTWFANMTGCPAFSLQEDSENVSVLKHHFTFLHFSPNKLSCFVFLTTGPLGPALPLSPCKPAGPWNRRGDSVWVTSGSPLKNVLVVCLLYMLHTCGPGAPIAPGVPDVPCKTQRHRNNASLTCKQTADKSRC